jgi:hypothetical protein
VARFNREAGVTEGSLACSLEGEDRAERARWIARLKQRSLSATATADGVLVCFAPDDQIEAQARAFARAEARCCPFLELSVTRSERTVELAVAGPPEARELIDEMFKAPP